MKKLTAEEVKVLLTTIDDLIEIKLLIREIVPNYYLNESNFEFFTSKIASIYKNLIPFFSEYLDIEKSNTIKSTKDFKTQILDIVKNNKIVLVSANSSKKKLKNIGVDPRTLIVSGGPLFPEDYKTINPNISNNALESVKKKCERILKEIENQEWNKKELIFIYEKKNPTDLLILNKIERISKIIGKKIHTFEISSWSDLEK